MPTQATTRDQPDPQFTRALLRDIRALQQILNDGLMEVNVRRVGAEQEMILVDDRRRASPVALDVLEALNDDVFTTELASFNIEVNVPPMKVRPSLFTDLEEQLQGLVDRVQAAASERGADVVLTGILPCLNQRDLSLENMTPRDRYRRLNEATMELAEGRLLLHITGTDELRVEHDSVMLEACNTSYQFHLQVEPDEFAQLYNAAQLVTAPLLAASANSPFLFGKRLWAETRIAVFRQSIDTRAASPSLRELTPRVRFGDAWVKSSVVELFEEDIVRFRTMMTEPSDEDPLEVLENGGIPKLKSLQLHNSTIYRWNRPCYGITNGRPHLRIECRALPAGPTVHDEIANSAFWLGAVFGAAQEYGTIRERLDFGEVKANFFAAARRGLNTAFTWVNGETVPARELITDHLIPLAFDGLEELGVDGDQAEQYLKTVERRVLADATGTRWLEKSAVSMAGIASRPERCAALTSAMISRQQSGKPVHTWELARIEEGMGATGPTVDQYMTTQIHTVHEDELVDLAAFIMDRERRRQILVEDKNFQLVGLISYRSLLRLLATGRIQELDGPVPVSEVMIHDPVTIPPDTPVVTAIQLMRENGVSCLPVLQDGKLVGVLSERDFMPLAAELLDKSLNIES